MPSKRNTRRSKAPVAAVDTSNEAEEENVEGEAKIEEEADAEMAEQQPEVEIKAEKVTGAEDTKTSDLEESNENPVKKPWPQKVKEGFVSKVPKDVQKRRRNFRLKKMIVPKAPVMILHEMIGNSSYDVMENATGDPNMPMLYIARTEYDGQQFAGNGPSKSIAKNFAAEQVLQYITAQSCSKPEPDMDTGTDVKTHTLETDTPWSALASLALYKLFNDWQSQGFVLPPGLVKNSNLNHLSQNDKLSVVTPPIMDSGPSMMVKPKKEKFVKPEKSLPENPTERHPVQLLNEMKGPLEYFDSGTQGIPPHCIFTLAVTVDDQTFSGTAKTKKEAKKIAAEAALFSLYNVSYQ